MSPPGTGTGTPVGPPPPPAPTVVPVGTSIVPVSGALLDDGDSAISLARYAQLIGYPECQFFGVAGAAEVLDAECRTIWLKSERDMVLKYLLEAQEEIENHVGYPLKPRWIVDDDRPYTCPLEARWKKIIEAGVEAEDEIAMGQPVDLTTDPAVVGPIVGVTFTDIGEVRVYHSSGTSFCALNPVEIRPSCVTIIGGELTIEIPRCRLVTEAAADNPRTGIDYADDDNFEDTVDVTRLYNDPSTHATLVWPHKCTSACAAACCSEYTQDGCIYIRNGEMGILDVLPAAYSAGAWVSSSTCHRTKPERVRLNYRAGMDPLSFQAEDAILRLAHSKMPNEPCGCAVSQRLWERDRNVPRQLTAERLNNPFGLSDGAWIAWKFAGALKKYSMSVL